MNQGSPSYRLTHVLAGAMEGLVRGLLPEPIHRAGSSHGVLIHAKTTTTLQC